MAVQNEELNRILRGDPSAGVIQEQHRVRDAVSWDDHGEEMQDMVDWFIDRFKRAEIEGYGPGTLDVRPFMRLGVVVADPPSHYRRVMAEVEHGVNGKSNHGGWLYWEVRFIFEINQHREFYPEDLRVAVPLVVQTLPSEPAPPKPKKKAKKKSPGVRELEKIALLEKYNEVMDFKKKD